MRFLLTTLFAAWALVAAASDKPNIVVILADDLGIGDVNCYGGKRCLIDTPNIDALAEGGLCFTDAHVNASVCAPTRLAIMSGRYPWRFGGRTRTSGPWGFVGPREGVEDVTLGHMLTNAGYRTGYVGKWHLGTIMTTTDGKPQGLTNVDYTKPVKFGAPQLGFGQSFILPGSLDMYPYAFIRDNVWQGSVTAQKGWSAFNRVGPAAEDFEDHEVLETFYREAESFLGQQTSDEPFFLYLALTAPHTPTSPGINWQGESKLGIYGDFVMEVDHSVERVVNALKKAGVYENTLILFSSDHGPACYAGNILKATPGQIHRMEQRGHFPSGPYRGYKFCVYEGGLRVPLIAHWPRVIPAAATCDALIGLNDLMATFADLADVKLGTAEAPDSISFANLLRDPQSPPQRQNLIMQSAMEVFVVRDGEWKLCLCPGSGAKDEWLIEPLSERAWHDALEHFGQKPKIDDFIRAPFIQLFDLAEDVHEDHNIASKHPQRVARMVALLRQQIERGRSTPGPTLSNERNVVLHQRLLPFVRQILRD